MPLNPNEIIQRDDVEHVLAELKSFHAFDERLIGADRLEVAKQIEVTEIGGKSEIIAERQRTVIDDERKVGRSVAE